MPSEYCYHYITHHRIFVKPDARRPLAGARAWFLDIDLVRKVCVCVSALEASNNRWRDLA